LVLAGAGSGKTRVITRRVAHLVLERDVAPWRVMAVTFTNKAAKEMRERLGHLLGPKAQGLTVSTFHSMAALLLRIEHEGVGLDRGFLIYDDSDQMSVARRVLKELGVENVTPRDLLSRIDQEKNAGRLPDQMKVGPDPKSQLLQRGYRSYQKMLHAANAVDFGDLLLLLVQLLGHNEEVRLKYQRRFTHVLVDEFQDTNPVQYQLLKLLAPPSTKPNLVVVGDDDQSIYRWRGAEVDNILNFPSEYPGAVAVKLEQNYRSDQAILEAAHAVISMNRRRMAKKLWSDRARGEDLGLVIARDERGEAQTVAERIHELRRLGIADYEQMAVFFRTNAQSRILEETFRLMRVPYVLVSGRSFYDRTEIKDAASYLRLMTNPKSDADFARVMNVPARGLGDTTAERLSSFAASGGMSLYEAIEVPERVTALGSAAIKRLTALRGLLESLVSYARSAPSATEATRFMLEKTGLLSQYTDGSEEASTRFENLRELLTATQEFDRQRAERLGITDEQTGEVKPPPSAPPAPVVQPTVEEEEVDDSPQGDLFATPRPKPVPAPAPPVVPAPVVPPAPLEPGLQPALVALEAEIPPLQAFLEHISLVGEADGETGQGAGKVSLMTLHAAKGLEFDAVFLTGMEEQVFPHRRALSETAGEEDMAEERRLCYVGFTRARRRLTVSFAQSRALFGELRFNPPSRFLAEVPRELFGISDDQPVAVENPLAMSQPFVRRRATDDDDAGPRVDTSFDQRTDFHGDADADPRGLKVHHSQFGRGIVISVNGRGPNAKLVVRFATVGEKTVIARFLTPV
jgi:DNA helicase II / ATP-dependent DNA helicase PcrA